MKRILLTIALASQAHAGIELCGLEFSPVPMPDFGSGRGLAIRHHYEAQAGIEANQGGYIRPMVVTPPKIGTLAAGEKYLWALAQIESGGNDYAHGRHGEVSRYQCMKRTWRLATAQPYSAATNAQIAATVTLAVIRARTGQDPATLTPEAFALAWHCPNAKHLNAEQRDYVDRFTNLVRK